MNYSGHLLEAIAIRPDASDAFNFAVMAPDMVGIAGTRLSKDCSDAELVAGVNFHYATDDALNGNRKFTLVKEKYRNIHEQYLPRGAARACADPGSEMLLDGYALQRDDVAQAFQRVMNAAAAEEFPLRQLATDGQALVDVVRKYQQHGPPFAYRNPVEVAYMLHRRVQSRQRLRFDASALPKVAETFKDQQAYLAKIAGSLFEDTARALSEDKAIDLDIGPIASIVPDLGVAMTRYEDSRSQFAAGHKAASLAMAQIGYKRVSEIGGGARGEPIFPNGFSGSIARSSNWAVAIVATMFQHPSVGVDIKRADQFIDNDLSERVAVSNEMDQYADYGDQAGLVIASLKKAVHKAIGRYIERTVGFGEVRLQRLPESAADVEPISSRLKEELGKLKVKTIANNDGRWQTSICLVDN